MKRKEPTQEGDNAKKTRYVLPERQLLINPNQKTNPIMKYITVPINFDSSIKCDFEPCSDIGMLYLSLKYHRLHPQYIINRSSCLSIYLHKFILVINDIEDSEQYITDLNVFCVLGGFVLLLCESNYDGAGYIMNCRVSYIY